MKGKDQKGSRERQQSSIYCSAHASAALFIKTISYRLKLKNF
jgi:hypothetical protein